MNWNKKDREKILTNTHDGFSNECIDGTGAEPSVNSDVAKKITQWIEEKIITEGKIIDFGAGVGLFQDYNDRENKFDVYSIEGFKNIPFIANKEKWIIKDCGEEFEEVFNKKFDMVISFEMIEHIIEAKQETMFNNMKLCADRILFSIHTQNQQDDKHCFIRDQYWWRNRLKDLFPKDEWDTYILITPTKGDPTPISKNIHNFILKSGEQIIDWGCSLLIYTEKTNIDKKIKF